MDTGEGQNNAAGTERENIVNCASNSHPLCCPPTRKRLGGESRAKNWNQEPRINIGLACLRVSHCNFPI